MSDIVYLQSVLLFRRKKIKIKTEIQISQRHEVMSNEMKKNFNFV